MDPKEQFKLMVEPQLKDRLGRLAARLGYASGNEFAAEALDQYAELLADLLLEQRDQLALIRKRQRDQLISKSTQGQESGTSRRK